MKAGRFAIRWNRLQRLFRPGHGDTPSCLAGREREQETIERLLDNLRAKQRPPRHTVLYGPRGNGKTSLLRSIQKQCRQQGIHNIWITPATIQNNKNLLIQTILGTTKSNTKEKTIAFAERFLKGLSLQVGIPGLSNISRQVPEVIRQAVELPLQSILEAALLDEEKNKQPFVLFIDEAHPHILPSRSLVASGNGIARHRFPVVPLRSARSGRGSSWRRH